MATGNDLFKLYRYDPSLAAAIIFIVLFLLITAWHSFILLRTKTWFFIPFVLGGFCQLQLPHVISTPSFQLC